MIDSAVVKEFECEISAQISGTPCGTCLKYQLYWKGLGLPFKKPVVNDDILIWEILDEITGSNNLCICSDWNASAGSSKIVTMVCLQNWHTMKIEEWNAILGVHRGTSWLHRWAWLHNWSSQEWEESSASSSTCSAENWSCDQYPPRLVHFAPARVGTILH